MTSAVTNNLRKYFLDQLKSSVQGADNYYVGFARSQDFTPATDISSRAEQLKLRNSLQSVKVLSNVSYVIPTVTWTSGTIYQAYDDINSSQTNFYVLNSSNEVYICIEQGDSSSIVEPTTSVNGKTFKTSDGYKWRFMYKMSAAALGNFKTSSYMPVKKIDSLTSIPEEANQKLIQDASISGEILSIAIDDAIGTGYTTSSSITITGDGDSASFILTADSDGIQGVRVDSSGGDFLHGSQFTHAATIATDGTGASLRPILSPTGGLGADPVVSLKSKSLMLQVDVQDDEIGTILSENDFRQVVLLKNPKKYGSDSDFINNTGNCLRYFETDSANDDFIEDELIKTPTGSALAKVFHHDRTSDILYYYQDQETGFSDFSISSTVQDITGVRSCTVLNLVNPPLDIYSGEILYLNNTSSSITREDNQTEDIRIVIELG